VPQRLFSSKGAAVTGRVPPSDTFQAAGGTLAFIRTVEDDAQELLRVDEECCMIQRRPFEVRQRTNQGWRRAVPERIAFFKIVPSQNAESQIAAETSAEYLHSRNISLPLKRSELSVAVFRSSNGHPRKL
jgi:hypothetical protein